MAFKKTEKKSFIKYNLDHFHVIVINNKNNKFIWFFVLNIINKEKINKIKIFNFNLFKYSKREIKLVNLNKKLFNKKKLKKIDNKNKFYNLLCFNNRLKIFRFILRFFFVI